MKLMIYFLFVLGNVYVCINQSPTLFMKTLENVKVVTEIFETDERVFTIIDCAYQCKFNDSCRGFNFIDDQATTACELTSKRVEKSTDYILSPGSHYYEEKCDFTGYESYCKNGASLTMDAHSMCVLPPKCNCTTMHRGDQCEKICRYEECPGCDLLQTNQSIDIDNIHGYSNKEQCLDNCSLVLDCQSVMYVPSEGRCVYKKESLNYMPTARRFPTTSSNVLYTLICV